VCPGEGDTHELSMRALELILDGISLGVHRRRGVHVVHDARRESRSARSR
jgi:hypothetical protein